MQKSKCFESSYQSTKVKIQKSKISIADKYNTKLTTEDYVNVNDNGEYENDQNNIDKKKRRIVRHFLSNKNNSDFSEADKNIKEKYCSDAETFQTNSSNLNFTEDKDEEVAFKREFKRKDVLILSDDSDDDFISSNYSISIEKQVLDFINNAPYQDLIEICVVEPQISNLIISKRPFASIEEITNQNFDILEPGNESVVKNKRKKTMGLKIVENAESRLKGYKAVDSLVKTCSKYSESIFNQMKKWGVDVTGKGELDVVDLDPNNDNNINHDLSYDDDNAKIVLAKNRKLNLKYIKHKPKLLAKNIVLNDYQQVGINWLNLLYTNRLSCILADEMGLGKTCQVIAFMAYLKEINDINEPHLVVVPSSTIENWLREFEKFCPQFKVQAYFGSIYERESLRYEFKTKKFDVLVTTYTLASGSSSDFKFLKSQNFNIIVYDEGHFLKNSSTERYSKLMKLQGKFRLLLTGTPLQNNLKELVSLLSFILPKLFNEKKDSLQGLFDQKTGNVKYFSADSRLKNYNPLLSVQAISKAKTIMTPFVLRRKKHQVLNHLPSKTHKIIYCNLSDAQNEIYKEYLDTAKRIRAEKENDNQMDSVKKKNTILTLNILMQLRKAALHPLLFRKFFLNEKLKKIARAILMEPEYVEANETYIYNDMDIMSDFELNQLCEKFPKTLNKFKLNDDLFFQSGKVIELKKFLNEIIDQKHEKVLLFSLFTGVLNILEKVLSILNYKFVRLDGSTQVDLRQDIIDEFNNDKSIPVFLLSTKAGGFGINLVSANNVILFDQSFNPHDDKQAEDRAHRVGQTKNVTVYKLISSKTIEENMLQLAENKLELDQSIYMNSNYLSDSKIEENVASAFEKFF